MRSLINIASLTFILLPLLFLQCANRKDPCEDTKHYYFFVKPEERGVLPYKGFDTLKLKHSSGTEYTYYAGAIDSSFYITTKATSPDCANNIIEHREGFTINFKTPSLTEEMNVSLINTSGSLADIRILLQKVDYHTRAGIIPLVSPRPNFFDYDSIEIQGRKYRDVRKIYENRDVLSNVFILYNRENGILKIVKPNGETFERLP